MADAPPGAGISAGPARARPGRRRLLSGDQVARAAFDLLDVQGPESLTIARLARELGVGPMTLYGYAASKAEIIAMLPPLLLAELDPVDVAAPWAAELERLYRAVYGRFVGHRHVTQAIVDHAVFERAQAEVIEGILELLHRAGFAPDAAFALQRTLNTYTLGFAIFAIAESGAGESRQRTVWPASIETAAFPRIGEVANQLRAPVGEEQFVRGLQLILAGADRRSWSRP